MNACILGMVGPQVLAEVDPSTFQGETVMVHGATNINMARQLSAAGWKMEHIQKVFCSDCGEYFPASDSRCSCGGICRQDNNLAKVVIIRIR